GGEPDVEVRPLRLAIVLHQRKDARSTARSSRDMETVFSQAGHDTIVINEAVVPQQNAIAAAPDCETRPGVDIHAVHESRGILTHHLDLAERGAIEDPAVLAHRQALARHRGVHTFPRAREVAGAL